MNQKLQKNMSMLMLQTEQEKVRKHNNVYKYVYNKIELVGSVN